MAGAEAGANLEREIFRDELAQFVADNAHLEHTAEVAEKARLAAVAETSTLRSELEAVRLEFEDLRRTRELQNAPAPGTDVSARALDVPAAPDAASAPTPDQVEILRLRALLTANNIDDRGASGFHYLDDHVRGAPIRDDLAAEQQEAQGTIQSFAHLITSMPTPRSTRSPDLLSHHLSQQAHALYYDSLLAVSLFSLFPFCLLRSSFHARRATSF